MSKVLVTGALGNVGRGVAEACARRGLSVRVAGRSREAVARAFPQLEPVAFDFLDRGTWGAALAGCDRVFLLRPPQLSDMAQTLIPFVDAAAPRHVVFLSVAGAERMAWVPHRKVELHLEASGSAWTLLRPGFFAQNLEDAYRLDLVEDDRLYVPAGRGRVAFVDALDLGEVAAIVFQAPADFARQALTLTGPEAIGFDAVATLLSAALGRTIRYVPASIAGYAWHLRVRRKLPWAQVAVQVVLHVGLRRGGAEAVSPELARLLGRAPTSMQAYIERAAAAWGDRSR